MDTGAPKPRADRRHLQEIIAGLTEGVIILDPDGSLVYANEAALRMHGVASREALGETASDYPARFALRYRNNHRLPDDRYPMDRLLAGESFSDVVVEMCPVEDEEARVVQRVRGLVLTDAAGEPESLVLVLHDETERFDAEERFERTFAANPAPAVICRLADLCYVKVNQGFLELTGYTRDDIVGRSAYEIDVLEGAAQRDLAVERFRAGQTIPQMETMLRLPDGSTRFAIVAGQPLDVGEEPAMLFTFMDLEPRKKVEDALRQSEERFSKAFRLAPVPAAVSTPSEFRLLDVNDAFAHTIGYAAEEAIGRTAEQLRLWASSVDRALVEKSLADSGGFRNLEIRVRTRSGELCDCLVSAETASIHGEPCVLSVLQDITERKRSEVELIEAIETVMKDTSWFSRTVVEKLAGLRAGRSQGAPDTALSDLTTREREVLRLLCHGLKIDEIAEELGVARNTVRNHLAAIYGKIGVSSRSDAIIWARDRGFPEPRSRRLPRPE